MVYLEKKKIPKTTTIIKPKPKLNQKPNKHPKQKIILEITHSLFMKLYPLSRMGETKSPTILFTKRSQINRNNY